MQQKTFELRLKSKDHRLADEATRLVVDMTRAQGVRIRGPIPLPVAYGKLEQEDTALVQSPDSSKAGVLFKRLLVLLDPSEEAVEALQGLNLPLGVQCRLRAV